METKRNDNNSRHGSIRAVLLFVALVLGACSIPVDSIVDGGEGGGGTFDGSTDGGVTGGGGGDDSNPGGTTGDSGGDDSINDEDAERAAALNAHINTLQYSTDDSLNVQPISTGASSTQPTSDPQTVETPEGNTLVTCTSTDYNLQTNFDEVAILRPANEVFPGALIQANSSLLDGTPEALGVDAGPITLSVDLPGIGEAGALNIERPSKSSVQVAVDQALESWNSTAYQDGYVNAANSSFQHNSAYSNEQAALAVGLNVEWAGGQFDGEAAFETSSERRVTLATFKQAFYTVTVDTPSSPAAMISPDVPQERALAELRPENAPAYVSSVVYGRILMVRMESSLETTAADAEAALEYGALVRGSGTVDSNYEQILEESSLQVVAIGGNAAEALRAIDPAQLQDVIQGENAVYSRSNPGVPIAYSVRNLRDNSLAKLGYTTDYTATECATDQVGDDVKITLIRFHAIHDCDGDPVNAGGGDFDFTARVLDSNGQEIQGSRISETTELADGEFVNVLHEVTFPVVWEQGESFTVSFTGSEEDTDLFKPGQTHNDDRMIGANASDSRTHTYTASTNEWSNRTRSSTGLGGTFPRALELTVGSGACEAELHYVMEFSSESETLDTPAGTS